VGYMASVIVARFLDDERAGVQTRWLAPLPSVERVAGDAGQDDQVDIVDSGIVGLAYDLVVDRATKPTDINADGMVDMADVGLVGADYNGAGLPPRGQWITGTRDR
jgi:hypothetical protein